MSVGLSNVITGFTTTGYTPASMRQRPVTIHKRRVYVLTVNGSVCGHVSSWFRVDARTSNAMGPLYHRICTRAYCKHHSEQPDVCDSSHPDAFHESYFECDTDAAHTAARMWVTETSRATLRPLDQAITASSICSCAATSVSCVCVVALCICVYISICMNVYVNIIIYMNNIDTHIQI